MGPQLMKYTGTIVALIALLSGSSNAIENARDLARSCQHLDAGTRGKGRHIRIPNTKEAQQCWGCVQAI
jgi:hypothetical protein